MKELLKRVFARPAIATELIVATLFINILAMASPLFVMQVLNRYVSQGVDATLATLTSGVLLAITLEYLFRQARGSLARGVNVEPDEKLAIAGYGILTQARAGDLEQIPPETRREMVNGMASVEQAYSSSNIATILDVPFSLIFVFVLYLLHPLMAVVVLAFLVGVFAFGVYGSISMQEKTAELQNATGVGSALLGTATREQDLVRAFNAGSFLRRAWEKHVHSSQRLRRDVTSRQGMIQTITQTANGLMSVAVITTGALLVVSGNMDVGAMIGANILSARALQPVTKLSQLGSAFAKARQALAMFAELTRVPLEPEKGSAVTKYSGAIELRDLAFGFKGAPMPLFESLNLKLAPGDVLLVVGDNGSGKTTLGRIILGLLEPDRGQILIDGLDLKQVALEWWRRQVIYMPQEPALLNATIEENLKVNAPNVETSDLNRIIDAVGLRRFLDESPQSFETPVVDNGWRLSEGTRRRLGLARALATNGALAVIDEPTESLDADGCAAVHKIMGSLVKQGRTIIIMSHDKNIVRGAHYLLDLNQKPVPTVRHVPGVQDPQAAPRPAQAGPAQPAPAAAPDPAAAAEAQADVTPLPNPLSTRKRGGD
ncbi:ATP-binding cassette domain-containing protein [Thalassospiraceae bacterium LMO-SO8]|nr:ATP-binding cassette domain-containing protein [Alphaproteobacteria bacterium LMO-S08]WND74635.1 ATP-binding cassette domain-containing protein [Thalassospiraceae bacterium LMO-SO8]